MEYPYRYRLSVSADMNAHIGSLTNILSVNKESLENEVADVHLNVPWAQQAEKKSQNPGF